MTKLMRHCSFRPGLLASGCNSAAAAAAFLNLVSGPAASQTPAEQVQTEVLVAPQLVARPSMAYPASELNKDGEGWVNLGFMVDTAGKPFEVTVTSSSGNRVFEQKAVEDIERATYKPGLLNGQPVESATEFNFLFRITNEEPGASAEFVDRYRAVQKAIQAKSRPDADAAMKLLHVHNLYEDAFFGLATYTYAREWGDETEQLAGLQRATAHDYRSIYLTKEQSKNVKLESLLLEIRLRRYAEVMALWPIILKSDVDSASIEKLKPIIHEVDQVRILHQPYSVSGSMTDATWHIGLYEANFRIVVGHVHISQVKLRCSKGFVRFTFDPEIEYKVSSKQGHCAMELDGDPGTEVAPLWWTVHSSPRRSLQWRSRRWRTGMRRSSSNRWSIWRVQVVLPNN